MASVNVIVEVGEGEASYENTCTTASCQKGKKGDVFGREGKFLICFLKVKQIAL